VKLTLPKMEPAESPVLLKEKPEKVLENRAPKWVTILRMVVPWDHLPDRPPIGPSF